MRTTLYTLTVSLAAAACVATLNGAAAAGSTAAALAGSPTVRTASPAALGATKIPRPTSDYLLSTCLVRLDTVDDGTRLNLLVDQCGFQINQSPPVVKESVPRTWPAWDTPHDVEPAEPDVLVSRNSRIILSWRDVTRTIGGVEVQPKRAGTSTFQANYFSGINGTGALVGSITGTATAPAGARLLAARVATPFKSMVITDTSGGQFAIANIRSAE